MKIEYLIFNLIVFSGPIYFGVQEKFNFRNKIPIALLSSLISAIPFLIWDSLVTNIHWFFNEKYIIGIKFFGLPFEEILFFISVPFACLFLWEMIVQNSKDKFFCNKYFYIILTISFSIAAVYFFISGLIYTALVFSFLLISVLVDNLSQKMLFSKNFAIFLAFVFLAFLIFNGYLTARPVLIYSERFITNIRITTIPVEDIGYGFSLIYLATKVYEKLKKKFNVRSETLFTE